MTLAGTKDQRSFYRTKTWWAGFIFTCLGEGANFVSYAFAPLALVAPLNAVAVLSEYSHRAPKYILSHVHTLILIVMIVFFFYVFQQAQFWAFSLYVRSLNQKTLQVSLNKCD